MMEKYTKLGISVLLSFLVIISLILVLKPADTFALNCNVPSDSYTSIQSAVSDPICSSVSLTSSGTYLESVSITRSVEIQGYPLLGSTINGQENDYVFKIDSGNIVSLTDLFITNGIVAGISNDFSNVTIDNVEIYSNTGTGIINRGDLYVFNSRIRNNKNGGIYNSGETSIFKSTITNNISPFGGGAIRSGLGGTTKVYSSTLSHNQAIYGGGIFACDYNNTKVLVENSTISNNFASQCGGGVYMCGDYLNNHYTNAVTVTYSTIMSNTSSLGSNIANGLCINSPGKLNIGNSIVASGIGSWNCLWWAGYRALGPNVSNDSSCRFPLISSQIAGSLSDNGGNTETHTLLPFSPAVDASDGNECPPTDQRNQLRPIDANADGIANCDIGAFEYTGPHLLIKIDDAVVNEEDTDISTSVFTVSLWFSHTEQISVDFETVGNTATSGSDFVPVSGSLYFSPGEISKTIEVPILGDMLQEGEETFFVRLSNPVNADIFDDEGVGVIHERDFKSFLPAVMDIKPPPLIVADFDSCLGTNNLGGLMGAAYNPPDILVESYVPVPDRGCVARLDFDIVYWSAFWMKLQGVNLESYAKLSFDIRANSPVPNRIKVELKRLCQNGECGEMSIIYVSGLTAEWQIVRIALDDFGSTGYPGILPISDWRDIEELVFTFEAGQSGSKGVVYVNDIMFEP